MRKYRPESDGGAVHAPSRDIFEPVAPEAHRRLVYWRPGCPHGDQAGTRPRHRGRSVGCSSLGPVQRRSRAPSRPGSNAIPWRHGWSTQPELRAIDAIVECDQACAEVDPLDWGATMTESAAS